MQSIHVEELDYKENAEIFSGKKTFNDRIVNAIHEIKADAAELLCAYLYDLQQLRMHVQVASTSLPSPYRLFYAVKANSESPILKTMLPFVHGFEVASLGEIEKVRAVDPDVAILFGGPAKTDEEICGAIQYGVKYLHVESLHELRRVEYIAEQRGVTVTILLRINLCGPLPKATLYMAGKPTQFGIDENQLAEIIAVVRTCRHVELCGFHFHSISNDLDAAGHAQLIAYYFERARDWERDYDLNISAINVGGGIGINYQSLEKQYDWQLFTKSLMNIFQHYASPHWNVYFECGRYLTAACGYYAVEVIDIKQNHGKNYVLVRGGTHHFRLPASWQHSHPFVVVASEEWRYPFPRPMILTSLATVAGQLCTPKDVLATDVYLQKVSVGDVLVFLLAGAYGWSISHHDFLSHPHPRQLYLD